MFYNLLIVLPFYNHYANFEKVATFFKNTNFPVLLVNDGSSFKDSKSVKKICDKFGFLYVEHSKNLGKGGAVLSGLKYAIDNNFSHILQIDSDGQHDINDIDKFVSLSKKYPYSIVTGSPIFDRNIPKLRMLGHVISKFLVYLETRGSKIDDTMCGFRIYPIRDISNIISRIYFRRMGFDPEIIIKGAINGIDVKNIKTKVIYPKDGTSHYRLFKDSIEICYMHFRLCIYSACKMLKIL